MPGFLTGLAQGIQANRETDLQTKRLGIEQQRADAESARFDAQQRQQDRENSRQDLQDQIKATSEQMQTLFDSNRSLYGALNGVPEAPKGLPPPDPNDPKAKEWYAQRDARESALNSPERKAAAEKMPKVYEQAQEIAGRQNALVAKLAGTFTGEVKDDAQVAKFNLEHGGPDAVSGRQLAHLAMADTGNNPAIFVKDPKTGQSPAEVAANKLIQAAQTHNFDGLHDEIGLLIPELHMGIGHELSNGNTVTKTPVTAMFLDPKDPTKVHVSYALHHEDDQGNPGDPIHSPHMADDGFTIPLQTLVDRAHNLVQKVGLFSDPSAQRKLSGAVQDGDTALHDFFNVARAHGVAEAGPITRELKKGVSLVTQEPGKAPQVTLEAKQYVPAQEAIFNELQAAYESGDPDRIAAAQQAAAGIHPSKYQPGAEAGGAAGVGATKTKYTASDRKDLVESLQAAVAQRLGGADLSDLQKGEDVFGASRIPDRAKAAAARNVFLQARNRMDADIRAGKQNVDIEDYLPKQQKQEQQAQTMDGPPKPKGTIWMSKDGKTKRVSLGDGKWQIQQ